MTQVSALTYAAAVAVAAFLLGWLGHRLRSRRLHGIASERRDQILTDARREADLLLVVGSRLGETDWWGKAPYWSAFERQRFIQVDVDEGVAAAAANALGKIGGDKAAAERWMRKAEAVAVQEADREKYHHKLEWLMSQGSRR